MTHIARLLLLSTLLLSPVGSTLVAAADESLGVLVVAHGSTTAWNATVEASVAIIQQHTPSQVAYLMGAKNRTPQEAYDDLVAAGVQRVVIVPLLVSSHRSHYEQIRFIGRLRDDYPGSDWMSLTPLHGPADVVGTQVLAKLVFTASPGNVWRAAAELYDTRVETDRSATAVPRVADGRGRTDRHPVGARERRDRAGRSRRDGEDGHRVGRVLRTDPRVLDERTDSPCPVEGTGRVRPEHPRADPASCRGSGTPLTQVLVRSAIDSRASWWLQEFSAGRPV